MNVLIYSEPGRGAQALGKNHSPRWQHDVHVVRPSTKDPARLYQDLGPMEIKKNTFMLFSAAKCVVIGYIVIENPYQALLLALISED